MIIGDNMKRGFTLIELLAVIMILGVISLIAMPTINKMVEETKIESVKRSAETYIKNLEARVAAQGLKGNIYEDKSYTINELNNLVKVKGDIPDDGELSLVNGKVTSASFVYGKYQVVIEDDNIEVTEYHDITLTKEFFEDENNSWDDVITLIKANKYDNTSNSDLIGAERNIEVGAHKNLTNVNVNKKTLKVRIANVTPCTNDYASKTACGFVLEFKSAIESTAVNSSKTTNGGYPAMGIGNVLNTNIYNVLPTSIKDNILEVTVISSHNSNSTSNYTSQAKLYLLDAAEIVASGTNLNYDTAKNETRRLDYYRKAGSTAVKTGTGTSAANWWTRTAKSNSTNQFFVIGTTGSVTTTNSTTASIIPAFRLN